ncbi:MAG: hypothetical protein ACR2MY_12305 [Candidatus Dormibacteria bacterium]
MADTTVLRGLSRTYRSATPGAIASALRRCGRLDPVILLDEVGTAQRTQNGDPFAPLLDILDPTHGGFQEDYVAGPHGISLDLTSVLWVLTTNSLVTVPTAVLDRCDIIHVPPYTPAERLLVLKNYVLPATLGQLHITPDQFGLTASALIAISGAAASDGLRTAGALLNRILLTALREHLESARIVVVTPSMVARCGQPSVKPAWWDCM